MALENPIQEVFASLKEGEATIYGFSIAYTVERLNWKKEVMFQGDFEVYRNNDMTIILDKIESRVIFVRDSSAEVIDFMKKLERVVFKVIPNAEPKGDKMEFDVEGYKVHAYVYRDEGEIAVRKSEVSLLVKQFVLSNYVVKRKEDVKGGGKEIEKLKEVEKKFRVKVSLRGRNKVVVEGKTFNIKETLKKLGFKFDSVAKCWEKETEDTAKTINELIKELDQSPNSS